MAASEVAAAGLVAVDAIAEAGVPRNRQRLVQKISATAAAVGG